MTELNIMLVACYRPPHQTTDQKIVSLEHLLHTAGASARIVIAGDLNIDILNQDDNTKYFLRLLEDRNLRVTNDQPTRMESMLDWFIVGGLEMKLEENFNFLSDHKVQISQSGFIARPKYERKMVKVTNESCFLENVTNAEGEITPGNVWTKLTLALEGATSTIVKRAEVRNPWWSKDLTEMSKDIKRLYGEVADGLLDIETFKILKLNYKKLIKSEKARYLETNQINGVPDLWKFLRAKFPRKPVTQIAKKDLDEFVDFYANLSKTVDYNFDESTGDDGFQFCKMSVSNFDEILKNFRKNTSPGKSGIRLKYIAKVSHFVKQKMVESYNEILINGVYPPDWKLCKMIVIYKGEGPRNSPASFRPITLIDVESRFLEKHLETELRAHLESKGLLPERQFGFRNGRSTVDCLLAMNGRLVECLVVGRGAVVMQLDVRKAFDSLPTGVIMQKLVEAGLSKQALKLLSSYLTLRKIFVMDGEGVSKISTVKGGVPQGSSLGPLLYILATADLVKLKLVGDIYVFADDGNIIYLVPKNVNFAQFVSDIQSDFVILQGWFNDILMSLNPGKTKIVVIGDETVKKGLLGQTVLLGGVSKEILSSSTFLGVEWDD